jgi:hypothetical protein
MKKLLPILSIFFITAILISACSNKPAVDPSSGKVLTYVDTVGLADFQKWKTQNELKDPAVYYQQGSEVSTSQPVRRSTKAYSTVQRTSNSSNSGTLNSVSQYPAKTTVKKGWSRKAKGAAIGGGGGAILGAVINKNNRLVGGAIGGALGAGIGYVIGNELDKKHGR